MTRRRRACSDGAYRLREIDMKAKDVERILVDEALTRLANASEALGFDLSEVSDALRSKPMSSASAELLRRNLSILIRDAAQLQCSINLILRDHGK
jgi:hypothetical protein